MFCEKCGNKTSDSAVFCKNCGAKIENLNEKEKSGSNSKTASPLREESINDNAPNSEQIKQYLGMVFDMETNLYVQRQTIKNLCAKRDRLGRKNSYAEPQAESVGEFNWDYAIVIGAIAAAVFAFIFTCWVFDGTCVCISSWLVAIPIGMIVGGVIGGIIGLIEENRKMEEIQRKHVEALRIYKDTLKADEERVKKELVLKKQIQEQINLLEEKKQESEILLKEFYGYNIVHPTYHYNIAAISSFYEYFDTGKTKSLSFNERTGDQGAYNIYSTDSKLGKIIENTSVIINQLDRVIENQRELALAMKGAQSQISALTGSVDRLGGKMSAINSSIKEGNAISAYNGERTQKELSYMNEMSIWRDAGL